jgi:hypothetical protein
MRLIVHAGLHKTGSTYLQHIMNDNHKALLSRGVYYEKQAGYPAHHFAAWDVLRGDTSALARMIGTARQSQCHSVIFSSEDLEGVIFDRNAAISIEETALAAGVDAIEWHMSVRDPGEYFGSLYAQLQHHIYADATAMLCEVAREGMMMVIDPHRGQTGTPFWCFCFDHMRYISAFAEQTRHAVILHDFRDAQPFPGWGILEAAGVLDAIGELPSQEARNSRMTDEDVCSGYCDQVLRLLPAGEQRRLVLPIVQEHVRRNLASVERYAEVVSGQFAMSMAAALDAFGYAGESDRSHRTSA